MLFERALDDEPVPPPGDLAQEAMAERARLRRRRGLLAGGSAAGVLAVLVGPRAGEINRFGADP
jgi:hypothetical protein